MRTSRTSLLNSHWPIVCERLSSLVTTTGPNQKSLRVGAASVDVTPPIGIRMQGYEVRYAEAVTDRLLVSALAVGSRSTEWLLLSVDCIGLDRAFTTRVRETLARSLSMAASAITIACSHTHSGPATLPNLGAVEGDDAYLRFLERQLTTAGETAAQRLEDVRWRLGTTWLQENVNRREWKEGRIELGVDPRGPVDSRMRVVRIDRLADASHSSPLALIVHYGCHATSSGGVSRISADWPGTMRTVLQTIYSKDTVPVVCFLQGCAGDVTHRIARDRASWPEHFGQSTSVQSEILGRLSAAAALNASEQSVTLCAETVDAIVQPLSLRYHRHSSSEETEAQVVRIGPALTRRLSGEQSIWIVALPGEPFTTYGTDLGDRLYRQLGAAQNSVMVCGYSNDAVGYLCTPRALREGGYEATRAHQVYHRPAAFSAATQALVNARVSQAASRLMNRNASPRRPRVGLTLKRLGRLLSLRPSPRSNGL
jgi:neutral ceramidase